MVHIHFLQNHYRLIEFKLIPTQQSPPIIQLHIRMATMELIGSSVLRELFLLGIFKFIAIIISSIIDTTYELIIII